MNKLMLAVSLALLGIAGWYTLKPDPRAAEAPSSVPTGTAAVARGTVTQWIRVGGTYGFDGVYSVVHQGAPGILTSTAEAGMVLERGAVLYAVDNRPVRLLYGTIPAFRGLGSGMSDGPDVLQLEQNLVAMGMDPLGRITVDAHFTTATGLALRRWQASWGLPASQRTGMLEVGQVTFLPAAVRISQIAGSVGVALGPNEPVLAGTSTARVVTTEVSADRQGLVKVGDAVQVIVPGSAPLTGSVLRIGRVANVPAQQNGQGGSPGTVTVTVVIGLKSAPGGLPDLDQAPVQVSLASAVRKDVLLLPVAALLARPGGGYRIRLATGAYVEVDPGLFDETTGKVEVTGELKVGDLVEVPVS